MIPKRIILFHEDYHYIKRFAAYLERESALSVECLILESRQEALKAAAESDTDLIIIPESEQTDKPEEAGIPLLYFTERSERRGASFLPMFRSMDEQIRSIRAVLDFKTEKLGAGGAHVIGFFSPVHGAGQSVSSLLMGMQLAEKEPALLLNLERFSGLWRFLPHDGGSLSDLLYYARTRADPLLHVSENIEYLGPLAMIPPVREPEDLTQLKEADWKLLIGQLRDAGEYRYILLDIGAGIPQEEALLSLCDRIYVPLREDALAIEKSEEWQNHLKARGREDILERLKPYRLPPLLLNEWVDYRELRLSAWGKTIKALTEAER